MQGVGFILIVIYFNHYVNNILKEGARQPYLNKSKQLPEISTRHWAIKLLQGLVIKHRCTQWLLHLCPSNTSHSQDHNYRIVYTIIYYCWLGSKTIKQSYSWCLSDTRGTLQKKKTMNAIRPSVTGLGSRNLKLKCSKSYKINRIKIHFRNFDYV